MPILNGAKFTYIQDLEDPSDKITRLFKESEIHAVDEIGDNRRWVLIKLRSTHERVPDGSSLPPSISLSSSLFFFATE